MTFTIQPSGFTPSSPVHDLPQPTLSRGSSMVGLSTQAKHPVRATAIQQALQKGARTIQTQPDIGAGTQANSFTPLSLDFEMLVGPLGLSHLMGHGLEDNHAIQSRQDSALARRIAEASAVDMPENIRPGEFAVVPLDIMPHELSEDSGVPGKDKGAMLLELNGTGYGNITTMEKHTLSTIMGLDGGFARIAESLKDEPNALVLIPCSGREDPPKFAPSKKIHEKALIAAPIASQFKKFGLTPEVIGLDSFDRNAADHDNIEGMKKKLEENGWGEKTGPTIVVCYTAQIAKAVEIGSQGEPYLFGRRVHAIANDRCTLNIDAVNKERGKKLNPDTFIACNRSYVPAADKGAAYGFVNDFNSTEAAKKDFPEFARTIANIECNTLDEIHEKVVSLLEQGKHAIIKPSGTGHGDGIVPFFDFELKGEGGYAPIAQQIQESFKKVKEVYQDRGGFPYTISEYVIADRINQPGHDFHSAKYEYRIAVYADYSGDKPKLKANPAIIKIDGGSVLAEGEDGRFSKQLASVSTQVQKTGRPASDFMQPLCNQETLKMINLSEEQLTRLCRWATGVVAHTLANVNQRTEAGASSSQENQVNR